MKIEEKETGIRLIPENQWERDRLKKLRQAGKIDKIRFDDDWNSEGNLTLSYPVHPWDTTL